MNTKTMRLPPRRVLTPNATTTTSTTTSSANNKRKEREKEKEGFNAAATITKIPKTATATATSTARGIGLAELVFSSNQILAGCLAHEFLTRGTLFGQQWDPNPTAANQNEAVSVVPSKKAEEEKPSAEAEGQVEGDGDDHHQEKERYVELANLLKTGGAHLPGIVNPTQLTHFLHKM